MKQRPEFFFPTLGGQIIYFIYKNCQTPLPAESIGCPQNKPGNKRTKIWNGWCQNNGDKLCTKYFFIFFSDNSKCFHRIGFEMYILIIIYTVCTCDTLVPMRILNSEISWFYSLFPQMVRNARNLTSFKTRMIHVPVYVVDEISWSAIIGTVHPKVN